MLAKRASTYVVGSSAVMHVEVQDLSVHFNLPSNGVLSSIFQCTHQQQLCTVYIEIVDASDRKINYYCVPTNFHFSHGQIRRLPVFVRHAYAYTSLMQLTVVSLCNLCVAHSTCLSPFPVNPASKNCFCSTVHVRTCEELVSIFFSNRSKPPHKASRTW